MEHALQFRIAAFDRLSLRELYAVARLRQQVFYLEQHVACEDWDDIDPQAVYAWAERDGATVGFLRIVPPGLVYAEASIGRVAVAASQRRQGIARRLVERALQYIGEHWQTPVRISSQEYIIPLYEQLGFEVVSERYMEAGIPHRKMLYKARG